MTYFEAYLLTRLDPLNNLFMWAVVGAILLIILQLLGLFVNIEESYHSENEINRKVQKKHKIIKLFKYSIPFLVIISFINSLIPTTKEAAFIYIAPAIVNNQDIQKTIKKLPELSGLGLEYLGQILKEEIKETKGEVVNEVKKSIK